VQARAEQGNINYPAYGTWTADFMLRQNESRAFLGKYLNDPRVPGIHKIQEMIAIAGIIPVARWLAKINQRLDADCRLCKRAREHFENLPHETYSSVPGHRNWQIEMEPAIWPVSCTFLRNPLAAIWAIS